MILNNYSPKVLDKNAFIDLRTRKMYLLSDNDIQSGYIPTAILYATIIPSALCLINNKLLHEAMNNQSCGYIKFSTLERSIGNSTIPWKFVPTPPIALNDVQKTYALSHGITHVQLAALLGHPLCKYQPVNKFRAKCLQLFTEDIWLNSEHAQACDHSNDITTRILDRFPEMKKFCGMFFGESWCRAELDGVDSYIGMVYNLKFRPFEALDQMTYLYLMLKGLTHNVASAVSEITYACIEDTSLRLAYRNRINNILYRNKSTLQREVGAEGENKKIQL